MPARRRDPVSVPRTFHSSSRTYPSHDYSIDDSISRAGYFSNAVLDDTDLAAAHSRAKDYDLLRNTQSAIAAAETHSTPRTAVASRKARASSVPPKVQTRPARLQQQLVNNRPKVAPSVVYMSTPPLPPPPAFPNHAPKLYASTPVAQQNEVPWRIRASSVQPESSRSRRAGSMPPRPQSYYHHNPGGMMYEPEPQRPLGTEGLKAHRSPAVVVLRGKRAGSLPPPRPQSFHNVNENASALPPRLIRAGSVHHSPRPRSYQPVERQAVGTEGLRAHRAPGLSTLSRAGSVGRLLPPRRPLDFGIDEVELEKSMSKPKPKPEEKKKRARGGFAPARATSEPPRFIPPSSNYPSITDLQERPARRQLFSRRGQVNNPPPAYVVPMGVAKSSIFYDSPVQSGGLHSSRPPLPKPTDRKAIRTVDGFSKPKNVMSWEHRVESRISPDDLIYQPQSISRLREQVRGCRDRLDIHRQMMDRSKSSTSGDSNNVSTPSSSRYHY